VKRLRTQRALAAAGLSLVTGTAAIGLAIAGVGPLGEVAASVRAAGAAVSRGVLSVVLADPPESSIEAETDDAAEQPSSTAHDSFLSRERIQESAATSPEDDETVEESEDSTADTAERLPVRAPSSVTTDDPGSGLPDVSPVLAERTNARTSGPDPGRDPVDDATDEADAVADTVGDTGAETVVQDTAGSLLP